MRHIFTTHIPFNACNRFSKFHVSKADGWETRFDLTDVIGIRAFTWPLAIVSGYLANWRRFSEQYAIRIAFLSCPTIAMTSTF